MGLKWYESFWGQTDFPSNKGVIMKKSFKGSSHCFVVALFPTQVQETRLLRAQASAVVKEMKKSADRA